MHRRLVAILPLIGLIAAVTTSASGAQADVSKVSLIGNSQTYSGSCPIDIVFTAIVTGDPGTILSHKFSGSGFSASKTFYDYIDESGSISINDTVTVDSAHAGSYDRQVEITTYVRAIGGSSFPKAHFKSAPVTFSVTCVASPSPAPSIGGTTSTTGAAPIYSSLDGVAVGDAPAPVLARLGLHPPGWAAGSAPKGSAEAGEVRQFNIDRGNATMMLFFGPTIQVVMIQTVANSPSSIADPYGIHLNSSLNDLIKMRGNADKVEDKTVLYPSNSDTIDHSTVWQGLHNPIVSDSNYIYGRDDGIRWEYTIKDNKVSSIRVVDCRVAGVCTPTKPG
jgi:hypothetical protein